MINTIYKEMANHYEKEFISIKEASILTGIQPQTLRKLGDQQKIKCYRTTSGQRKFHKASLEEMCHPGNNSCSKTDSIFRNKQNFIYARVSCNRLNKNLQNQINMILLKDKEKYSEYQKIMDVSTGTNFNRKGLNAILKACFQKNIGEVVITSRDRLCIVGFELIENIITSCGGCITILDKNDTESDNNIVSEMIDILQKISRNSHEKIVNESYDENETSEIVPAC